MQFFPGMKRTWILNWLLPVAMAAAAGACSSRTQQHAEDTAHSAGDDAEHAAHETGEAVEEGADESGEAVEKGADKTGQAVENAGDKVEEKTDSDRDDDHGGP